MLDKILIFLYFAQSPRFFVNPSRIEKFCRKDKTYTEVFVVEVKDFPAHIEVYVEDFFINEYGAVEFKKPGSYNFSLSPFINITPRSFDMEPNEKKEVRVSFTLPDTMKSYEKWCMLIFRCYPKKEKIPFIQVVGEIGVPIYVLLPEGNIKNADLIEMGKDGEKIYFSLKNFSPIHLRTNGKIFLINENNEKVFEKNFLNEVIMPFQKRKYLFDVPKNVKKGKYHFFAEVDYGGGEILKGEKELILP